MSDAVKKWFLLQEGQVRGPFNEEEIEVSASKQPEGASPGLVWGRGLAEWLTPAEWRTHLKTAGPMLTEAPPQLEERHWRLKLGEDISGPFTYDEFIEALKKVVDFSLVEISNEPAGRWRDIYAFQKVVDELGITRRAHPRVPIMGTLTVETPQGPQPIRVVSISQGGLGISDGPPLAIGDKVKGVLKSANLYSELPCNCEVVYIGDAGYVGLRFLQMPADAQSAVIEYVNKFKSP